MKSLFKTKKSKSIWGIKSILGLILLTITMATIAGTVAQSPLFLVGSADPNVLFNMSVETPMGGAAYNDQPATDKTFPCAGRGNDGGEVGICYFPAKEYIGYFNPNTCYTYTTTTPAYFTPSSRTGANHTCSGKFSGNFMNWATMTATDMFIKTMTGGNRIDDGADDKTIVQRARKTNNDSWFPFKEVSKTTLNKVDPRTVTPFNQDKIFIYNSNFTVQFDKDERGSSKNDQGIYNVNVRVCEKSTATPAAFDLENNCTPYNKAAYYKPEGLIQKNAEKMRFGVTSYSATDGNGINGGVLRANMKYVGATMKDITTGQAIPNRTDGTDGMEINADGTINLNPNSSDTTSGIVNSGVIPYLNKFSQLNVYKSNDPASELFYESIRYFKNLGPTPEYLTGANGGFPIIGTGKWKDPIQHACQKNFIIGMNDANPWMDKKLPGTYFKNSSFRGVDISIDFGEPSNPDRDIDVRSLTNKVGELEKLNGTSQCIGYTDSNFSGSVSNKIVPRLGEVMGTCPGPSKQNSYYIAGLAYYANTNDIRKDLGKADPDDKDSSDKQTITTFMIDTQEYNSTPLVGRMNMLWLAGKYGGFNDKNGNGTPDDASKTKDNISEWDADGDTQPDNYVLASQPENLVKGLNNAFNNILRRTASSSAAAANSTQFTTNAVLFQALFSSVDWTGELRAFKLISEDLNGNSKLDAGEDLNNNKQLDNGLIGDILWKASERIPVEPPVAGSGRHIFTYNPQLTSSRKGIEFLWANLNKTQKTALDGANTTNSSSPILDYLRGNQSKETVTTDAFRRRSSILGDIINSNPLFVAGQDLGYGTASGLTTGEKSSYPTHVAHKKSNKEVIYVGANDGMLHAFDASPNNNTGGGGTEIFAYVPNAAISPELASLKDVNYAHKYFIDGSPNSGDVFFSDNTWHTVLVGSMGAGSTTAIANPDGDNNGTPNDPVLETGTGGRGIFALDITNPTSFTTTNVLWEFTNRQDPPPLVQTTADADLGYTIPVPSVVRMNDGKWRVIVGNGYNSAAGKAVLFILDAQTGAIVQKLTAEQTLGGNGLSSPTAYDADGDGIVDYIYAGDLKGNMWKFDVTGSTSGSWKIAYSPIQPAPPATPLENVPVFTACYSSSCTSTNRQPITAPPAIIKANNTGQTSGAMIYFGTGKYFEDGDHSGFATSPVDTFYGLWDKCDKSTSSCSGNIASKSSLQQQAITSEFNGNAILADGSSAPLNLRVNSDCEVAYGTTTPTTTTGAPCNSVTNRFGWYMQLISPDKGMQGERVVNPAIVRNDVVIFTTMIPFSSPCKPEGTGWLMELSTKGSRFQGAVFDANGDGVVNDNDMVKLSDGTKVSASGFGSKGGFMHTPAIMDTGNEDTKYISISDTRYNNGLQDMKESPKCTSDCSTTGDSLTGTRESWRQLR